MTYDLKLPFDPSFRHTVLLCDCVADVYYYVLSVAEPDKMANDH